MFSSLTSLPCKKYLLSQVQLFCQCVTYLFLPLSLSPVKAERPLVLLFFLFQTTRLMCEERACYREEGEAGETRSSKEKNRIFLNSGYITLASCSSAGEEKELEGRRRKKKNKRRGRREEKKEMSWICQLVWYFFAWSADGGCFMMRLRLRSHPRCWFFDERHTYQDRRSAQLRGEERRQGKRGEEKRKKVNVYGVSNEIAKSQVHLHTKNARGQRSEELKMMREGERERKKDGDGWWTRCFFSAETTNRNERLVHVCSSHSASISLWITFGRMREEAEERARERGKKEEKKE